MTSETEREGNVPNPFLNPIRAWQNYLVYWNVSIDSGLRRLEVEINDNISLRHYVLTC